MEKNKQTKKLSTLNKTMITALMGIGLIAGGTPAHANYIPPTRAQCELDIKSQGFSDPEFIKHETNVCVEQTRTEDIIYDEFLTLKTYEYIYHLKKRHDTVFEGYDALPNGKYRLKLFKHFPMKNGKAVPTKDIFVETVRPGANGIERTIKYLLDTLDKEKLNDIQK